MEQKELFELIFSDAHLVDIDLSMWDKRIALYILADHVGRIGGNRLPMFVVEFTNVRTWNIQFNHLSYDPPIELEADEHVQWWAEPYKVEQVDQGMKITLGDNSSSSPTMTFVCEDVNIWEMSYEELYTHFPGWGQPRSGFIRPGLDVLLGYSYADRLQGREYAERRLQGKKKGRY